MNKKNILAFTFILILQILITNNVYANTYGYAWGENVGWLDSSEVVVSSDELSGYLYSGNIGWISLNCSNTNSCDEVDYKISNNSGDLSGYAWGENIGWINMDDVSINSTTGIFSGYAYSGNIGWISFNCSNTSSCDEVDYSVKTDWLIEQSTPASSRTSGTSAVGRFKNLNSIGKTSEAEEIKKNFPNAFTDFEPSKQVKPSEAPTKNISEIINILISLNLITEDKIELITSIINKTSKPTSFTKDLEINMVDEEVLELQKFLNENGYTVATEGPGSPGNETNIFGQLTQSALIQFQLDNNISPAIGYFGPITRGFIN